VELARAGLTVVATMRDTSRAAAAREAATAAGVELDIRALDVTDHVAMRSCVDGIVADHGRIDVLVNNAGRGSLATAEQLTMEQVRDQVEVNYLAPVALTRAVLPAMREAGRRRILTVTSEFVANVSRPLEAGSYDGLLAAYVARSQPAFANAQSAQSAGAAIARVATSSSYRFRWQTSDQARVFAGTSLADLDGEQVTRAWIS